MTTPFPNAPNALSAANIKQDVADLLKWNLSIQRYSSIRNSFVVLSREYDEFVMADGLSGSEHRLSVDATNAERLAAHWTQFTSTYAANI